MEPLDRPVYLDHAATTPPDPAVIEAMQPLLGPTFGNASSIHSFGRSARAAIDEARDGVAALIRADYSEIYFTSSGTEADNLAILGAALGAPHGRDAVVTSAIEHPAVLNSAKALAADGRAIRVVGVDPQGLVSPQAVAVTISDRTALVSVMYVNNEVGTIQPIREIARLAHERGALFHTDAVQAVGMTSVDVTNLGCDLLTLSAHKIYGPKGAAALYIRSGTPVSPILHGGTQEREKRPGTQNVAAIAGFGVAARLALGRAEADAARIAGHARDFEEMLLHSAEGVRVNGHPSVRAPHIVNVSVHGVDGAVVLMNLDRLGVAASSGSACSSGAIEPSHVLIAMGLPPDLAGAGIRFSLGRNTTRRELCRAAEAFREAVHIARAPASRAIQHVRAASLAE